MPTSKPHMFDRPPKGFDCFKCGLRRGNEIHRYSIKPADPKGASDD